MIALIALGFFGLVFVIAGIVLLIKVVPRGVREEFRWLRIWRKYRPANNRSRYRLRAPID
jgi:hypothetical protein